MAKKIIYFVRHGETILNAAGIRQGAEGALNDKGREQVTRTGEALKHEKKFQCIIASPFQRTVETADIISKALKMPVEYCDLLRERKNPSEIIGKHKDSPEVRLITDRIDNSFHGDDLRYSDEENFYDLKQRARALLHFLKNRKEKRILCVTHGIFLKMVGAYILFGEALKASDYIKLSFEAEMDNAGIVVISYTTFWFKKPKWQVLLWNGIPHE